MHYPPLRVILFLSPWVATSLLLCYMSSLFVNLLSNTPYNEAPLLRGFLAPLYSFILPLTIVCLCKIDKKKRRGGSGNPFFQTFLSPPTLFGGSPAKENLSIPGQ